MASDTTLRSPLLALVVGVLLLVGVTVLGRVLFVVAVGDAGVGASFDGGSVLGLVADSTVSAGILLGGIYAAFRLDYLDRPLLVVAPVVFVSVFLLEAGTLVTVVFDGLGSASVAATAQLINAFTDASSQTVTVVAVTVVVKSLVRQSDDGPAVATTVD